MELMEGVHSGAIEWITSGLFFYGCSPFEGRISRRGAEIAERGSVLTQMAWYLSGWKMLRHSAFSTPLREILSRRGTACEWPQETRVVARNALATTATMAVLLMATVGCGPSTATVAGKVTFQGEPITIGTIAFIGPSGKVASATIQDGAYTVADVETGAATVTVTSHEPSPMMHPPTGPDPSAPPPPPLKYVPIPERYSNPKRSGETYTVLPGKQTYDVVLKP
jgi:hypothetical protein